MRWVTPAVATGLFTGIHLDIEPWTLCDWRDREDELLDGILLAVEAAQQAAEVSSAQGRAITFLSTSTCLRGWRSITRLPSAGSLTPPID